MLDTKEQAWHALPLREVLEKLDVTTEGLTSEEAAKRLSHYGKNQLKEAPRPGFWHMLWGQLNNFVVMLLIVASIVSALLGDYIEAGAIMAIVVLNAILGIVQEQRAEEALAALKRLAAPDAQVVRDGHRQPISARGLVPGDIVYLEAGNYVPADVRLLETMNLKVEEAALTGESVPVQKVDDVLVETDASLGDRKNAAFMGTLISYGRGMGVVVGTGMSTQLGLIATMLQGVETEETPLQRRLDELGRTLSIASLILVAIVFIVALVDYTNVGELFSSPLSYFRTYVKEITDVFIIAVSLAIAAVPEGLPAVVTISLALGMREMIQRHALIRKLASVETLGSATVICSDKTGTMTQNEMTVTHISVHTKNITVTGSGYNPHGEFLIDGEPVDLQDYPAAETALWVGALNNDAILEVHEDGTHKMIGDPTEGSIIVAAAKANKDYQGFGKAYPRVQEIPFDSVRKRMTTIHKVLNPYTGDFSPFNTDDSQKDWYVIAVKGAPDVVLELCQKYQKYTDKETPLDDEIRKRIRDANDNMAQQALRVIAVAYKVVKQLPEEITPETIENDLTFAGLIGMIDPPRLEVSGSLETARRAGIRTLMITGDYAQTARAIAETIGLMKHRKGVLTGADLNKMDDAQLVDVIDKTAVFARVSPEHKMRIVDALQANGEVVAMTGDGVNDAPAIKRGDIGVAMGITGTDVAKETADMVLTDDNYASIVSAVEQGRIIYSNIRKFVYYLLSCNVAEIMVIFLGTLIAKNSPLTAIQLLWLNLVTDGAPALALSTEKGDPDIMDRKPRPKDEPIINRFMQVGIVIQTLAITGVTLAAYFLGLKLHPEQPEFAEAMAFVTLSLSELVRAYTARSEYYPLHKIGIFSNRNMNLAVLLSVVLIFAVIYIPFLNPVFNTLPLGWQQWKVLLPLLLVPSLAAEAVKLGYQWLQKRK